MLICAWVLGISANCLIATVNNMTRRIVASLSVIISISITMISHQKRITGLAFSTSLNILVSSGADAHLCVCGALIHGKKGNQLQSKSQLEGSYRRHTSTIHSDQIRMLVVHETQLAIYDASKMERIRQWIPQDVLPASISYATYSCNSQSIYATFCDGNLGVFDADSLRHRCRIASSVYLSQAILKGDFRFSGVGLITRILFYRNQAIYPLVVAALPIEANQFAIGLSDGYVKVVEPTESEGKWGVSPPVDNGVLNGRTTSSSTTSSHTPEQFQR